MAPRLIRVRYAGPCSACGTAVAVRASAWWDGDTKAMTCEACGTSSLAVVDEEGLSAPPTELPAEAPVEDRAAEPPPGVKAPKRIKVRFDGACADCASPLPAGSSAWWEAATKTMRCPACGDPSVDGAPMAPVGAVLVADLAAEAPDAASMAAAPEPPAEPEGTYAVSMAGGSAQREHDRRKAKREDGIRTRHPRIGGLILALSEDPQSTMAWAKGAVGERKLGAGLDGLAEAGVVALHDRLIPGTRANIDHLAVAPSGVWVIDAKRYTGQVAKRDVGGWLKTDLRLHVGRRDCTKLVVAMAKQVAAVRKALGTDGPDVPVHAALCFVDAEWGLFAKPFSLGDVLVSWPKALRERLRAPGPYTPEGIRMLADQLDERLRPAVY